MFTQKNFCLTDEEYEVIAKWAENHECSYKNDHRRSCCGGEISVVFTPTTIGTIKSARCVCGKELVLDNI